jgi:ATP dependent DNA ligase domain
VFLSLRHSHDVQKSPRFGGAKFLRNHDRSGLNHVLGRPYCRIGAFVQVHGFEHGEGMFGDLLIVRISSHGSDSLRPVENVVTGPWLPALSLVKTSPSGSGWAHELKHDGYRLQIHVRNGRVRLYTMNGADWTKRYPRIVEEAARLREPLTIDAEVVHLAADGSADFDALLAALSMTKPWPSLSIFFTLVTISGISR